MASNENEWISPSKGGKGGPPPKRSRVESLKQKFESSSSKTPKFTMTSIKEGESPPLHSTPKGSPPPFFELPDKSPVDFAFTYLGPDDPERDKNFEEWYHQNLITVLEYKDLYGALFELMAYYVPENVKYDEVYHPQELLLYLEEYIEQLLVLTKKIDYKAGDLGKGEIAVKIKSHKKRVTGVIDDLYTKLIAALEENSEYRKKVLEYEYTIVTSTWKIRDLERKLGKEPGSSEWEARETENTLEYFRNKVKEQSEKNVELQKIMAEFEKKIANSEEKCMQDLAEASKKAEINTMLNKGMMEMIEKNESKSPNSEDARNVVDEWYKEVHKICKEDEEAINELLKKSETLRQQKIELEAQHANNQFNLGQLKSLIQRSEIMMPQYREELQRKEKSIHRLLKEKEELESYHANLKSEKQDSKSSSRDGSYKTKNSRSHKATTPDSPYRARSYGDPHRTGRSDRHSSSKSSHGSEPLEIKHGSDQSEKFSLPRTPSGESDKEPLGESPKSGFYRPGSKIDSSHHRQEIYNPGLGRRTTEPAHNELRHPLSRPINRTFPPRSRYHPFRAIAYTDYPFPSSSDEEPLPATGYTDYPSKFSHGEESHADDSQSQQLLSSWSGPSLNEESLEDSVFIPGTYDYKLRRADLADWITDNFELKRILKERQEAKDFRAELRARHIYDSGNPFYHLFWEYSKDSESSSQSSPMNRAPQSGSPHRASLQPRPLNTTFSLQAESRHSPEIDQEHEDADTSRKSHAGGFDPFRTLSNTDNSNESSFDDYRPGENEDEMQSTEPAYDSPGYPQSKPLNRTFSPQSGSPHGASHHPRPLNTTFSPQAESRHSPEIDQEHEDTDTSRKSHADGFDPFRTLSYTDNSYQSSYDYKSHVADSDAVIQPRHHYLSEPSLDEKSLEDSVFLPGTYDYKIRRLGLPDWITDNFELIRLRKEERAAREFRNYLRARHKFLSNVPFDQLCPEEYSDPEDALMDIPKEDPRAPAPEKQGHHKRGTHISGPDRRGTYPTDGPVRQGPYEAGKRRGTYTAKPGRRGTYNAASDSRGDVTNRPSGDDSEKHNDTGIKRTIALASPGRKRPLLLDIELQPRAISESASGEHVICDIALDVQQTLREKPQNVVSKRSPYSTERPHDTSSTPKSIFSRRNYGARRNLFDSKREPQKHKKRLDNTIEWEPQTPPQKSPRSSDSNRASSSRSPELERTFTYGGRQEETWGSKGGGSPSPKRDRTYSG